MTRVLITGAAGNVAGQAIPALRDVHDLRLTDVRPVPGAEAEVVTGDLLDDAHVAAVMRDVSGVVHLAGHADYTAGWDLVGSANVTAADQVLRAARDNGVGRVVIASSIHAMGGYARSGDVPVDPSWRTYPCCVYGASKVAAEALGHVYATRCGLPVTCLRLGWAVASPNRTVALDHWLSPRDLACLLLRALAATEPWGVYFGISGNSRRRWSIDATVEVLGYQPIDDAERFAAELERAPEGEPECFR